MLTLIADQVHMESDDDDDPGAGGKMLGSAASADLIAVQELPAWRPTISIPLPQYSTRDSN